LTPTTYAAHLGRTARKRRPHCPWCGRYVDEHEPAVEQIVFGFSLIICAYAPIGEIAEIGTVWETPADG
jgi:hypothetical protein